MAGQPGCQTAKNDLAQTLMQYGAIGDYYVTRFNNIRDACVALQQIVCSGGAPHGPGSTCCATYGSIRLAADAYYETVLGYGTDRDSIFADIEAIDCSVPGDGWQAQVSAVAARLASFWQLIRSMHAICAELNQRLDAAFPSCFDEPPVPPDPPGGDEDEPTPP